MRKSLSSRPLSQSWTVKVSSVEFSNEDATTKSIWLPHSWLVMFAGEDISSAVPITRRARQIMGKSENTLENVVGAMETAYQEYLSNQCHSRVLGRWHLKSVAEFREIGRKQFGTDVFDTLCHQIDQVRIRCTFLVCGLDVHHQAHIFTASHPGVAENRDDPGYWAIGNGKFAAMSLMSFFRQSVIRTLEETIYNVFTAKLMAETASGVGDRPFYWRINRDGYDTKFLSPRLFLDVREEWNRIGKPLIPDGMLEKIKQHLATSESDHPGSK